MLIGDNEGNADKALYASEHATTSKRPYVSVTYSTSSSITLTSTVLTVTEGASMTIGKTTTPSGVGVTWNSSNPSVATVSSSGAVTGIKAGTATITATTELGATAACTVYVTIADGVYWIRNVSSGYYLDGGGANISPENLTNIRQRARITAGNDRLAQMWKLKYLGSGQYSIRPMHKLDLGLNAGSSDVDLKKIGTTDTFTAVSSNARWSITYDTNGYVLKGNNSISRILKSQSNSNAADATIVATTHSGTAIAHRWLFEPVGSLTPGVLLYDMCSGSASATIQHYLSPGETLTLSDIEIETAFYALTSNDQNISWSSSNNSVVSVNTSTGTITGIVPNQSATITASKTINGVTYTNSYTVNTTKYHAEVYNYFDDGFRVYYGETPQESAQMIHSYMGIVERRYREILGLDIEYHYPVYYYSALDQCKGTVTPDNLHSDCNHSGQNHHYLDSVTSDFMGNYVGNETTTRTLWSCHRIVAEWGNNRSVSVGTRVFMITRSSESFRDTETTWVLMHELNHQYGAPDHYHEEVEGGCRGGKYCSECGTEKRPATCIMNAHGSDYDIMDDTVLCDGCKADILAHLDEHHMYD